MKGGETMKWSEEKIIEYVNNTDKYIFIKFLEYKGVFSLIKVKCKKDENHGFFDVKFNNLKSNEDRKRESGCCKECKKEMLSDKIILNSSGYLIRILIIQRKLFSKN